MHFSTTVHLSEKLQFVGWVMGLSLGQTPTGIGEDGIHPVIMDLDEDSPQARPASISVQLERFIKVSIGQNGHCGAQTLQLIKGPFAPVILGDGCPLLTCIFAGHQFMQGPGYMCKLGDKLVVIHSEPKKALDLGDCGEDWPLFDNIYFLFVSDYSLDRDNVPQVCDLHVE